MRYFPVNLDIAGRSAVIVGGGKVAERKCFSLLEAGADIVVIAPRVTARLKELVDKGAIAATFRPYSHGDLTGAWLAFAVTDDPETNLAVAAEANTLSIPVNVADEPDAGSFTSPAHIVRGELLLTVSTGGKCPFLAARLRKELAALYGDEYAATVDLLGAVREKLLTEKEPSAYNKRILEDLADHNLPLLFKENAIAEIDRLLLKLFGPGYSLAELEVREKDPE